MLNQENLERENLAKDMLDYAKECVLMEFPFFTNAMYQMKLKKMTKNKSSIVESMGICDDSLCYDTQSVLELYGKNANYLTQTYLHALLHFCFRHDLLVPEVTALKGNAKRYYSLAADIAVTALIQQLDRERFRIPADAARDEVLKDIESKVPFCSAQYVMEELIKRDLSETKLGEYEILFLMDDHRFWTCNAKRDQERKKLTKTLKTDLDTFFKKNKNKGLFLALKEAVAEPVDYASFLRRFACAQEQMHINDEEFDLGYYLYGLQLNEKIPLVEPLEYAEQYRIKDFVIAIDTSGSTAGYLVQAFLDKTFTILQAQNSYTKQMRIHIIQCDDRIQSDTVIHNKEEMEKYVARLNIKGFGATDFKPVFQYVEELRQQQKLRDLRGLIYFTDGRGSYPATQPNYETAFVFIDDEESAKLVPPWAVGISLPANKLREG